MGRNCLTGKGFYFGVTKMFWNWLLAEQHCECTLCHRIVCFKMADFMLCEFHLSKLFFLNTFLYSLGCLISKKQNNKCWQGCR